MSDANCACVPYTGRALWALRARVVVFDHLDVWFHRVTGTHHIDRLGRWPCWNYDDAFAEQYIHDHGMDRTNFIPVDVVRSAPKEPQ